MSARGSIWYTLAAWLPLALVLALTAYLFTRGGAPFATLQQLIKHPYDDTMGFVGHAFRGIALVSVAMGIVYIPHLLKNPAAGARTAWIVGFIFVAAVVLPIYWYRHARTA